MIKKFLQDGLGAAFPKCLEDSAVLSWNLSTQRDIMRACIAFVELSAEKLKVSILSLAEISLCGVVHDNADV